MKVGFIGLGSMGVGMAHNLHVHGLLARIWNRSADKARKFADETGCAVAESATALASQCDVVILCVSADGDLLALVEEISPAMAPGGLVIDCSTVSAATARRAAEILAARSCGFLDAPVSGGVEGARNATLTIMVGGDTEQFARARPVFDAIGKLATHFGGVGCGQAAKATNQILCAGAIQAAAEAMAFAKAEGLPLDKIISALSQGAGASWYFTHRAPNMMNNSYAGGFRVKLHDKDLKICREMAAQHGVQLPLIEMTLIQYRRLIEQGHGDEDISALFRLKDGLFESSSR